MRSLRGIKGAAPSFGAPECRTVRVGAKVQASVRQYLPSNYHRGLHCNRFCNVFFFFLNEI